MSKKIAFSYHEIFFRQILFAPLVKRHVEINKVHLEMIGKIANFVEISANFREVWHWDRKICHQKILRKKQIINYMLVGGEFCIYKSYRTGFGRKYF